MSDETLSEPFVGIKPYTLAQAGIFYERQDEARALLETILNRRVVLLFGESGNGKSSLINAGLVPMLATARFKESFQPEILRIDQDFAGVTVDRRPLASDAHSANAPFQSLFREISSGQTESDPLSFTLPVEEMLRQLRAYLTPPPKREGPAVPADAGTIPIPEQAPGPRRHVLLMFDQFEELYTFSGGRAAFSLHSSRDMHAASKIDAQDALARQIGGLLRASLTETETSLHNSETENSELPVKFLFVFREEYLVKLQALLPDLQTAASFRLPAIPSQRLAHVIEGPFLPADKHARRPAALFAGHEQAGFFLKHASSLRDGFAARTGGIGQNVLTELQVVGMELWRHADDRDRVAEAAGSGSPTLMAEAIDEIISRHFQRALDDLKEFKSAALDVLCELVTSYKTRNIVSEPSLREKLCIKDGEPRRENTSKHAEDTITTVLKQLAVEKFINRAERNGTVFYDIASESLIPWLSGKRNARLREIEQRRIREEVDEKLKETCLEISKRFEMAFIEIGTDQDHVHFLVQSVPMYSPKRIVQIIKSITAREIFRSCPEVKKKLWGGSFGATGTL